ncbi:MAG: hypothetical protein R3E95_13400 [Thiolinea sp.]
MSIQKIKANYADFEGEYLYIKRKPFRFVWGLLGFIIGIITSFMIINIPMEFFQIKKQEYELYTILITLFSTIIFMYAAGNEEDYIVPKVDVLTIKKYPIKHKVTVVLDDERTKRRQPVTTKNN